jgi:hypothetical protein
VTPKYPETRAAELVKLYRVKLVGAMVSDEAVPPFVVKVQFAPEVAEVLSMSNVA